MNISSDTQETAATNWPMISVAIPFLNEQDHLAQCLESVIEGDFPNERIQLIAIDGRSEDDSRSIAESYEAKFGSFALIDNVKRLQSDGLNLAIEMAAGEYFVRLDAHTSYQPDYITSCVTALQQGVYDNAGGLQIPTGSGGMQSIIATALTSPFSMGPSSHRHSDSETSVETVFLGSWRTENLKELGGFSADWAVNEDYELNHRITQAGGKILLMPHLRSEYSPRATLAKLSKQYFRYGYWRARTVVKHPGSLKLRQLAPSLLVLLLAVAVVLALLFGEVWALAVPAAYLSGCVLAGSLVAVRDRSLKSIVSVGVFPVLHISFGVGFGVGVLRWARGA
jgi:succinoglycan biosynthesis protein ExoA